MIGCLLFGASLFMVAKALHRHHHGGWAHCGPRWYGHAHRWHHHGHGGCGPANDAGYDGDDAFGPGFGHGPSWGRGGFRNGFVAGVISERLEASPAQERVIRDAVDEFREAASKLKGEGRKTRADVADAFRKSSFDEVRLGELYARHDGQLTELRKAFVGMGARIHDALDEKQRARLADLIEEGPRAFMSGAFMPRFRRRGWV
ncbi:MAG TPA: periplasmic heavy metal sensor [Polyangia bacterium]|jgi:uncharacterized membrane protein|nr:periplasmic heavy metal sensor [Polyangia bacterium]